MIIELLFLQGEVAFFEDGDRYDGKVEIAQQHPGNVGDTAAPPSVSE